MRGRNFLRKRRKGIIRTQANIYLAHHSRFLRKSLHAIVGTKSHPIYEALYMQSLKLKGIIKDVEHEKPVGSSGTQVDIYIPRTSRFITMIERPNGIDLSSDTGEDILHVVVDFTHTLNREYVEKKFWKEYQDKNTFFYTVLINPDATSADADYDDYLNNMPDDRYPDHVKVILQDDFNSLFRIEKDILMLLSKLDTLIEDCLDFSDNKKQERSLDILYDLNEEIKALLKYPLSQQRLVGFSHFFNF